MEQRRAAAVPALSSLREGRFDQAGARADDQLSGDAGNPHAHLVRAIVRYEKSMRQLSLDLRTTIVGGISAGRINHKYLRSALEQGEADLANVESDLAIAAADPEIAMELCIACWEIDWTGDGRIDRRDRLLFQIEHDADDRPIPEDDPRRKPTFRFDVGDVAWARAFVSFQRALIDFVLAYDWSGIDKAIDDELRETIVLRLVHPDRIAQARDRILEGIDRSDEARRSYLAETDDDREWVPNPRQKNHPMPLPVDQALYDTWEGVLGDLRRLVRGEEGLSVADLVALGGERATNARGFIDVGSMLAHPHDITLAPRAIERASRKRDAGTLVSQVFGDHYVATMKPSPLPKRLLRMKGEIEHSEDELDRKLRYFFWIN
jgi:hypothetical protein